MQGKGIIKFFLVVMTIVCFVQYLFILPTRKVEKAADKYAKSVAAKSSAEDQKAAEKAARIAFLDSMSTEDVFRIPLLKTYTYQELKGQQLALGLDLKGGMSVVLQVDLRGFIRALANDSKDPTFLDALEKASEAQKNAQSDYVTLFANAFSEVANGKKLAPIFSRNEALRDQINYETTDAEVIRIIRTKADETVDLTFKLLKERIDKLGVAQPNVSLDASRDLILVELPGIDNPERAKTFLQAAAKLEFWNVFRISDAGIQNSFIQANQRLNSVLNEEEVDLEPEILRIDTLFSTDSLGNQDKSIVEKVDTFYQDNSLQANQGPLFDIFTFNNGGYSPSVMGTAEKNQRKRIDTLLARPDVRALFPQNLMFRWSKDPVKDFETNEETNEYELYAIKMERGQQTAPLAGDHVVDASAQPDPQTNAVAVSLKMDNTGTKIWGQMTTKNAQDNNREIAIVLDNEVVSAPRVINPILTGDSQITGNFSIQEAKDLSSILQIGKLPAETKSIQESVVGPTLGQENIDRSIRSLFIGFLLVFAFMIFYYGGGGIVAIIALLLNLIFIFGALASIGTVLTLPGIAGIVLTIGMAVDANVIIFERIREELREGKSVLMAIQDGFKHSYSAIIDANVTTILTAIVLAYFGLGPIKGFAVVLIIGVLSSLFTAVLVGRLVIDYWTGKDRNMTFSTKWSENAFANLKIDWLGKRKIAYIISGTIITLGLISFFVRGFDLGVDFKGGYSYNVEFEKNQEVDAQTLRVELTKAFDGQAPVVKVVDTENTFNVVTDYLVNDDSDDASSRVMQKLYEGVNGISGGGVDFEQFKAPDGEGTHVSNSSKVGPTIADDIKKSSVFAAVFALVLIFLYIFIRFSKWQYSMGAVAALFHDVLVVLSLFSIFYGILPFTLEIDQPFIAAILTVIGYSINDTVVVFDRIREFLNTYHQKSKTEVINMAINSTVSRTVITSVTTFFVVAILFTFGGASIKGFAFALLVGIIVGTYSSIFVATPVMSDLSGELAPKETKKKKASFSKAAQKAK
ncbi:MAG: protein translocase subunit SecDF [Bacteroidetes bacterium]|nr:protein translocase subunit SecDF [Bacteroidota bacterium]